MTPITTLPEHLKPMVEKAARASHAFYVKEHGFDPQDETWERVQTPYKASYLNASEAIILAFLNACLDGGVAVEADGFNRIDGMEADSTPRPDGATFDFRALILNLGEAK